MTNNSKNVDLEALCHQVFSGVYRSHGEKILNERRALLFAEASKALYLAGYSESEIGEALSSLQEHIETYLDSTENSSASPDNDKTSISPDTEPSAAQHAQNHTQMAGEDHPQGKSFCSESASESAPEPNKLLKGIWSVFQFSLALVVMSGIAFLGGKVYDHITEITHPSLSYDGSIEDHYQEAIVDCKAVVLSREHLGYSDPEYLGSSDPDSDVGYAGGGKVSITFSDTGRDCISIVQYKKLKQQKRYAEEYEARTGIKVYSPEYWEQLRLESWKDDYRHQIIARIDKLSPSIDCHIDIDEMPHRDDRQLFDSDIQDINEWIAEVSEEFDQCLRASLVNAPDIVSDYMVGLVDKLNEEEGVEHDRHYDYLTQDELIHDAQIRAQKKWIDAINKQSDRVFSEWDDFRAKVLTPRSEAGAKQAQQWAREQAEEQYAKEFKEKYGMNPDDRCSYEGRTVKCADAPWITNGLNGWDDGIRTLNKISEFSRQANEDRKRRAQAELDEFVRQYEAQQAINDYKNPCGPDVFHDKSHRDCLPVLTDDGPAKTTDWEESQRRADQRDREARASYADKRMQASESRKASGNALCSDPDNANKCYCIPRSQWANPEGNCVMDK